MDNTHRQTEASQHARDATNRDARPEVAVTDFSRRPFGRCGLLPPRATQEELRSTGTDVRR